MATATSKQDYIDQWTSHVNQLIHPAMDADMPIEDYDKMKLQILSVVERAAAKVFEDIQPS